MPPKKSKPAPSKKQNPKAEKAKGTGTLGSIKKMLGISAGKGKDEKVAPKAAAGRPAGKGAKAAPVAAGKPGKMAAPAEKVTQGKPGRPPKGEQAPAKAMQGKPVQGKPAQAKQLAGKHAPAEALAAGAPVCREVACELIATTGGYCRMHYIKNWKKIKRKEMILKEKKLNSYIEELVSKYPDKYIEAIRQDLASEKDFAKVIADLEIEEGLDDFESVETESAEGIIDNLKRDFEDEGDVF